MNGTASKGCCWARAWRQGGRRIGRWGIGLVALGAVVVIAGCEGGSPKPINPVKRERLVGQPEVLDPGLQQPGQVAPPPEPTAPAPGPEASPTDAPPTAQQPAPVPDDVTKWKKDDFIRAKKTSNQRLLEAIQYLAVTHVGKPEAAEILRELLKPVEPEQAPPAGESVPAPPAAAPAPALTGSGTSRMSMGGPAQEIPEMPSMGPSAPGMMGPSGFGSPQAGQLGPQGVQAVISALLANKTDPARQTLRDVVTGGLKTEDDRTAATSAIAALCVEQSPANDAVLLVALTEPEKYRKSSGAGGSGGSHDVPLGAGMAVGPPPGGLGASGPPELSAEDLQRETQRLVEQTAGDALRERIARYLVQPSTSMATRARLRSMMEQAIPQNVAAQLVIYQDRQSNPEPQMKERFETYFAKYSATALAYVLGVLADVETPAAPTPGPQTPASGWGSGASQPAGSGWGGTGGSVGTMSGTVGGGRGTGGAMGMAVGLPSGGAAAPGGLDPLGGPSSPIGATPTADPALIYRVAKRLWEPAFCGAVDTRLAQAPNLAQPNNLVPLARTMPVDVVRAGLFALLKRRVADGPANVISAAPRGAMGGGPAIGGMAFGAGGGGMGVSGIGASPMGMGGIGAGPMGMPSGMDAPVEEMYDPGFLIVVKLLPREPTPAPRARSLRGPTGDGQTGAPDSAATGMGVGLGVGGNVGGNTGAGGDVVEQWNGATEALVKRICQQCAVAASRPGAPVGGASTPIEPHPGAQVTTRFDLKWPANMPAKLAGFALDPLEVHYVRIEENADPVRLLNYYKRVMKRKHREVGHNEGAWYDLIQDAQTAGRKQSIDVLITRPSGATPGAAPPQPGAKANAEPLVIEILSVEMNDPGKAEAAPVPRAATTQ
ncbi:MAG: hypothetical protein JW809_00850 [Pirellulales bacterium]|nr:hypothetical protein [Pirellulales bacterium]